VKIRDLPRRSCRRSDARAAAPALLATLLLAGCSRPGPGASLFPLEPGRRWVYDVKNEWENNWSSTSRVHHHRRRGPLAGGRAWRRRSADGVDWWLRVDDGGIYRVATKSDLDEARPPTSSGATC
jgi:hypothetical protein